MGYFGYALLRFAGSAVAIAAVALLLVLLFGDTALDGRALVAALARLSVTLPLTLIALFIGTALGVAAGYAAAAFPVAAPMVLVVTRLLAALPAFWIGLALVLLVAGVFRQQPPGGFMPWEQDVFGAISSLVVPALALALPLAAATARVLRGHLARALAAPEVLGARIGGLSLATARRRKAWLTLRSLLGLPGRQFGATLAGAMIVETVFYLPGLGRLLFDAVAVHDVATVAAVLLVVVALSALGGLAARLGEAALDPRRVAEAA